jgi:HEAT repeat protein
MAGKEGANLSRKFDTLERRSPLAQSSSSRSGLSKVTSLFRGSKPAEPRASSAQHLAKTAASSTAEGNVAATETAEPPTPSIAELAATLTPEEPAVPTTSTTIAKTGSKIEFSFGPAEFPTEGTGTASEQLHPSLLELPITPAPAEVAHAQPVEPKPAAPLVAAAQPGPAAQSSNTSTADAGAWILGRSEEELVAPAPATNLLESAAVPQASEPALLSSVVDVTPPAPQPSIGAPSGLFADEPAASLPAAQATSSGLLAGTSSGLLDDAFHRSEQEPQATSDPWTFATDISQPADEPPSFPIAMPSTAQSGLALPVAAVSQPAKVVQAAPIAPLPRLIDVCGPLPLQVKSLVLQLDIPEAGIRKEVLADLAALGEKARPALPAIEVLLDDDPLIAAHAAWTMWEIDHNDQAVIEKMVRLMECGRSDVVQFAAYSLGSMGANALTAAPALRVERERHTGITRLHIAEAMTRIDAFDAASVEVLTSGLTSQNQSERWLAAIALGQVQGRHANLVVPALTASLKDTDPEVRSASALSLGGFGKAAEPALAELQNRAKLDAPSVREAAATALACIQRKDASKTVW